MNINGEIKDNTGINNKLTLRQMNIYRERCQTSTNEQRYKICGCRIFGWHWLWYVNTTACDSSSKLTQCLWYFNQDANAPMIIDQSSNTHQSRPPSQGQQCLDSDNTSNFDSNVESDEDEIQRPQVSFATCCQQE